MKLRIGYLKERKLVADVGNFTVEELENAVRAQFEFDRQANIGIYLGALRVNDSKTAKVTELGVVSGDLLMVKLESDDGGHANVAEQSNYEQVDVLQQGPSTSSNAESVEERVNTVNLDMFPTILHERLQQIGYEKTSDHLLDESFVKTEIYYFKSNVATTQVRCACSLFYSGGTIRNIQLDITLINGDNLRHFDRLDFNADTSMTAFDDFIYELKTEIFGPDNPMLKVMFCGDANVTLKFFEMCGLEAVIALRKTCKVAYKKSNSRFLDQRYYKKEFIRGFGEHQLPTNSSQEPTPYRKALFRKLREHGKAACLNAMRESARQEMASYYIPRQDIGGFDSLRVPPRTFPPRRDGTDPLNFDPLQNFNDNFYGNEVYRPRNPNPFVPNAPTIYPFIPENMPPDPDMPPQPFGTGGRGRGNRFI